MKNVIICMILILSVVCAQDSRVSLDVLLGANISWIDSEGELERYFIPVEGSEEKRFGYNWGLGVNVRLTDLVTLNLEGHFQKTGMTTEEKTVTFPQGNNPSVQQTLYADHEFTYLTFPLYVKFGHAFERQWFNFGFGPAVSWRTSYESKWVVDGVSSSIPPKVSFQKWDAAASFKGEYGFRINEKNGVLLSGTYNHGIYNIVSDGPDGKAHSRIISAFLGYRYFF